MDNIAIKEVFDRLLLSTCLMSLAGLSMIWIFLKIRFYKERICQFAKRHGWSVVIIFFIWSAWATYTAFPTSEEKEEYRKAQREQDTINNAWAGVFFPSDPLQDEVTPPSLTDINAGVQAETNASGETANPQTEEGNANTEVADGDPGNSKVLNADDFARGFVLTRIGTNEVHDFTAPSNAVVCADWLKDGAAEDWIYLAIEDWAFLLGTNAIERLRVFSSGEVHPIADGVNAFFAPLKTNLGIVPEANWELLSESNRPSIFWYATTPHGALQLTWQNILLGRCTNSPASFQMEMCLDGNFTYRYDLSRAGQWIENAHTNTIIGAEHNGHSDTVDLSVLTNLTSLTFQYLNPQDSPGSDADEDGLTLEEELFTYHTDPYNADSDYDGLSDYDEVNIHGTGPLDAYSAGGAYIDGITVKIGNLNPFDYPVNSTNTVLEHLFYSGSVDGAFSYPMSTDVTAVLKVSISGTGTGSLVIGDTIVPLIAPPAGQQRLIGDSPPSDPLSFLVSLVKGITHKIYFIGDSTLNLAFSSDDFAFGLLPNIPNGFFVGRINFPNTVATIPCIHDFNARKTSVHLPVNEGAELLTSTWQPVEGVEIENKPPRSAEITGNVSPNSNTSISYVLSHPNYLFGINSFTQQLRFCPHPPEPDPDEDINDPPWYSEGDGDDPDESGEDYDECWCCYWGLCDGWCGCDCDCVLDSDIGQELADNFDDVCPEHNCPYSECASLHIDEYTNTVQTVQHLGGVLYIREPPVYEQIHLDVPAEHRNCCPCPDHWTNYVGVAYKSHRLRLLDENGNDFKKTDKSCTVNLAGVYPSSKIGDAYLSFSRIGELYQQQARTVLGVGIKGDGVDLNLFNTLNRNFGLPMTICTNRQDAVGMRLVTNVKLPSGKVHLELAETTGKFSVWYYDCDIWDYRLLLDSETMPSKDISFTYWRKIMKRASDGNSAELPIYITSPEPGKTKLVFRYFNVIDGKFVEDTAYQYISSVKPPVRPDMTRDAAISDDDITALLDGRVFHYWTNEETVKGDYVGPSGYTDEPNTADLVVNGTYDLVNFFPLTLDFQKFREAWGDRVKYIVRSDWGEDPSFNFCFANLPWDRAGAIQTSNVTSMASTPLSSSQLATLSMGGAELPYDLLTQFSHNSGLMICEALKPYTTIYVDIKLGEELLYSYVVPMRIMPVRDMYNWYNFRPLSGENSGRNTEFNTLWGEDFNKSLIFLHGANVSSDDAEKWGDAIFKRMWLSGMKARFYNVDWRSNIGSSANYHENASNAFVVASQIVSTIGSIPGEKVIMAHSLGNMVVSSMIQDYGLQVSKYLMCNSAVPAEAYDSTLTSTNILVHKDWNEYPKKSFANEWYRLFEDEVDDDRQLLTWGGRFENVADYAINFYSTGDHVLELYHNNNLWATDGFENWNQMFERFSWHKQELWKGRKGVLAQLGTTDWAGWSIRENVFGYNSIQPTNAWLMSDTELKTNTVFKLHPASMNEKTIPLLLRGAILANGISSRTPASGASSWGDKAFQERMYNLEISSEQHSILRPNGWITRSNGIFGDWGTHWLHSDMKDVSYFYVFKLFEKFNEVGGLK